MTMYIEDLDQWAERVVRLEQQMEALAESGLLHNAILAGLLDLAAPPALPVMKLHPDAILPTRGSDQAIGLDLYAYLPDGPVVVYAEGYIRVPTGIAAAVPNGYYARVAPRSGLAVKAGIDVLAGVVDEDYRGDISVILINHGDGPFMVSHGDRIAQLVLERAAIVVVEEVAELPASERGAKGFGSTGTR